MLYPPPIPSGARINTTPQVDAHPDDHVKIHAALASILNECGIDLKGPDGDATARLARIDAALAAAEATIIAQASTITAQASTIAAQATTIAALPTGVKAYAQRTTNSTGFSAATDIASLTVTWTAVSTRRYRISSWFKMTADNNTQVIVTSITDASNAGKIQVETDARSSGFAYPIRMEVNETGLSGSITRKVRALRFGGSGNINLVAAADAVAFIMVEDIGPA